MDKRRLGLLIATSALLSGCGGHRPTVWVTAPGASTTPTPAAPAPPPPPVVIAEVSVAPRGPAPARVPADAAEVLALAFSVTNHGPGAITLDGFTVRAEGRLDDSADVSTLRLAEDVDGDGAFDRSIDRVLSSAGFAADDGDATFSASTLLGAGDTFLGLITVDLSGSAQSNDDLRLLWDTPVQASPATGAGIVATRVVPFAGPVVRVGPWTLPHQALDLPGDGLFPRAVRDNAGNTHLAVYQNHNGNSDVWYSFFDGRAYSPVDNVSRAPQGAAWNQDLAVDDSGLPHLVWEEWDTQINDFVIRFSRFDAAAFGWTAAETVSNSTILSTAPRLAIDGAGRVHVVWEDFSGPAARVLHRSRDAAGWSAIRDISEAGTAPARTPAVATLPSGDVFVCWAENTPSRSDIRGRLLTGVALSSVETVAGLSQYVERPEALAANSALHVAFVESGEVFLTRDAGAGWSQPLNVSRSPQVGSVQPALAAQGGEVHVAWIESDPNLPGLANHVAYAQTRGGGLSDPEVLTRGQGDRSIPTILAEGDRIKILWQDWSLGRQRIFSSWREPGLLEAPREVTAPGGDPSRPAAAQTRLGEVSVAYAVDAGGNHEVFVSVESQPGAGFALAENVSRSPTPSYAPTLAATSDAVFAAWEEDTAGGFEIHVARRDASGWGPATAVSAAVPAYAPTLAATDEQVAVAWSEPATTGSGDHDIFFRVHDGTDWSAAVALQVDPATNAWAPNAAFTPNGDLAVAWEDDGASREIRVAVRTAAGLAVLPVAASARSQFAPRVAWRGDDLIVLWLEDGIVRLATLPAGAAIFDAPVDLNQGGAGSADVGVTNGTVVAAWEQWSQGNARAVHAVFDGGTWSGAAPLDLSHETPRKVTVLATATGGAHMLWTTPGRITLRERRGH